MTMVNFLKKLKVRYIEKGSFGHNTLTLISGTIIAQIIVICSSPFLTRLYSPNDFGIFAIYYTIVMIVGCLATAHYGFTITLPIKDDDAIDLLVLSLLISLLVSLCILILILLFKQQLFNYPAIKNWIFFVPPTILFFGVFESFSYWLLRKKEFKSLSIRRIIQFTVMTLVQITAGLLSFGYIGLIIGFFIGQIAGYGFLIYESVKENFNLIKKVSLYRIIKQAKVYRNYPRFSMPSLLISKASIHFPNILLTKFFDISIVGFFSLPMRILEAPLSLISQSILDVFKERATREYRVKNDFKYIFFKILKFQILIGIVPFTLVFLFAPKIIPIIFGPEWKISGEFTRILSLMFFFKFISGPSASALYILEKQKYELVWQISLFLLTSAALIVGGLMHNYTISIAAFSITCSVAYVIYILIVTINVKRSAIRKI